MTSTPQPAVDPSVPTPAAPALDIDLERLEMEEVGDAPASPGQDLRGEAGWRTWPAFYLVSGGQAH